MKAQQIVDTIAAYSKVTNTLDPTCDVFISGGPDTEVTGIITTFMATVDVIRKAVELSSNMIITHEPTYYTGWDRTEWLRNDAVYASKKKLIEENNIVIWRCHDLMHLKQPDGIYEGLDNELGWGSYKAKVRSEADVTPAVTDFENSFQDIYIIPETTLKELAEFFKTRLQMDTVRIIGNPDMPCTKIGILVGGGSLGLGIEELPMKVMKTKDIEVMVCGEITEWTLCAYVNDAYMLGFNKALLIIGHERSEEWGMKYMAQWLKPLTDGVPVQFVDAKEPFRYL